MECFPKVDTCIEALEAGKSQLVWTMLPADLETPVSAMLKVMPHQQHCLLFESVEGGESRARYSIIALDPDLLWRCEGGRAEINRRVVDDPSGYVDVAEDPFTSLRALIDESHVDIPDILPSMASGIFGYFGYDMVGLMEQLPQTNADPIAIPDSIMMRPQIVIIFDSVKDESIIITPIWKQQGQDPKGAYKKAVTRLDHIVHRLKAPLEPSSAPAEIDAPISFTPHGSKEEYYQAVEKAKEYILDGDIFQVVLSRRLSSPFPLPPFALYRALRHLNPSPYMVFMQIEGVVLVGLSPETLVKVEDDVVTIRPIAGTRWRSANKEEDKAIEADLMADQKELSEHLMLLDLGRNDVGRVAKTGTVEVTEKMVVERYSHVMHISSNVEGKLREDVDAVDALIAGFPAGTVSGAPKIRAMEIIDELETEKRSFYSGGIGYISASGELDTCIALRTALIKDNIVYVQAGGGIVADSVPEAEFQETENKAGALMAAAKNAKAFV